MLKQSFSSKHVGVTGAFLKLWSTRFLANSSTSSQNKQHGASERPHEEITIPMPWGVIAGKWYGSKDIRPIVGMHGWQDNAGTFDTLAPLLPQHIPFLSLDMPGHGLSSHLPEGLLYHSIDYVLLIQRIMEHMQWEKISILAHSMSSINSFVFAALQPEKVDMLIGLDALKPMNRSSKQIIKFLAKRLETLAVLDKRAMEKSEPPAYEWDDLVQRLHLGSSKSISIERCKYLLERNVKPSALWPNKYYFSRDVRLRAQLFYEFSPEVPLEMAKRIKCPHLFIKAIHAPHFEDKEHHDMATEACRQNPLFEDHLIDGTHHVHLNEPERVAEIINPFILKWRPIEKQ